MNQGLQPLEVNALDARAEAPATCFMGGRSVRSHYNTANYSRAVVCHGRIDVIRRAKCDSAGVGTVVADPSHGHKCPRLTRFQASGLSRSGGMEQGGLILANQRVDYYG